MTHRYGAWARRLNSIRSQGQYRQLKPILPTGPTTGILEGKERVLAASNDYLGLAWSHKHHGRGAGSSRLITGTRPMHVTLERELEEWLGRPALLFGSGYQANLAVFSTCCTADQTIASDERNHASIIDGIRLSRANRVILPHADPTAIPEATDLIAIEGLFSMDGDIPPISDYPSSPLLAVDEAHALGCLGPGGRGASAAVNRVPDILIGTFGKAFGAAGAFVAGPPELRELLINAGRSFIYTTAPPESVVHAALQGLRTIRARPELRERLQENAHELRRSLRNQGWEVLGSAHILPILTGEHTMEIADHLLKNGVFAPGIRYPTVARGSERIRVTLSAAHTPDQLRTIADAFESARIKFKR